MKSRKTRLLTTAGVLVLLAISTTCSAGQGESAPATAQEPEQETGQATAPTEQPVEAQEPGPDAVPEAEVVLATGPEDIVGMWTRALEGSATSYYFKDDGTFNLAFSTDPEVLENSPGLVGEYWFDGSQLNVRDVEQSGDTNAHLCPGVGVYEVVMLETGNLLFQLVADECTGRVDNLVGPGFVDIEYEPLQ